MTENNESSGQEVRSPFVQDGGEIPEHSSSSQKGDVSAPLVEGIKPTSDSAESEATGFVESSQQSIHGESLDISSDEDVELEASADDEQSDAEPGDDSHRQSESKEQIGLSDSSTDDSEPAESTAFEASQDASEAVDSEQAKKRRKRKKRRKQPTEASEAEETTTEDGAKQTKRREASVAPFARFLSGSTSGKKHVFAINEVVAGRVVRCEQGATIIDLFGKAIAVADEFEPRDIPPQEPLPTANVAAADESTNRGEAAELSAAGEFESVEVRQDEVETLGVSDSDEQAVMSGGFADNESLAGGDDGSKSAAYEVAGQGDERDATENESECDSQGSGEKLDSLEDGENGDDESSFDSDSSAVEEKEPELRPDPPKIGQIFKGRIAAVAESGHVALINRIIDAEAARERIEQYQEQRKRVLGLVFGFNRGGFDVMVEGIRAFCPASGMSLDVIDSPKDHIGKKLEFTIPKPKGSSKDLIISRRSILEKEHRKRIKEFARSLKPGQKCQGKVTQIRDYGLFVDIGGVEGLVHQSELSYAFGAKPQDVAQLGDEIEVQVIKVSTPGEHKKDLKRDRITRVDLSIKALLPDPWETHANQVAEGTVQQGRVIRTTDFGAFIELAPSVEGLLHISELGRDLKHANQVVKEGEEIYVVVERADKRTRRISLSKLSDSALEEYKQGRLVEPGERPQSLQPGARVKVKVEAYEQRGLIVRVLGAAGRRGRGYLPNNETGTERGTDLRKKFPLSTELEVKIIGAERDGGLKCSLKAVAIDDERRAIKEYRREASKQGFGTFGDLLRAKLGEVSRE
ncbi:MAG: S1 RNA-binding domain-containing protein [Deltaproteobacteria bacterium]|nr:S1 RNA-binding domain-containing protein [Deltaproteobacteria bacterium]